MAEQEEGRHELTARLSAATEIELEIDESDLELFAECIRKSGKVTLRLSEIDPSSTITGGGITKIVLD
jgi:hypothetical protein